MYLNEYLHGERNARNENQSDRMEWKRNETKMGLIKQTKQKIEGKKKYLLRRRIDFDSLIFSLCANTKHVHYLFVFFAALHRSV